MELDARAVLRASPQPSEEAAVERAAVVAYLQKLEQSWREEVTRLCLSPVRAQTVGGLWRDIQAGKHREGDAP